MNRKVTEWWFVEKRGEKSECERQGTPITKVCPTVGVSLNNHYVSNTAIIAFFGPFAVNSTPMPVPVAAGTKRNKPSTFRYLPVHRDVFYTCKIIMTKFSFSFQPKKLLWVEKTKIKSKWKAQKREAGLDSAAKLDLPVYDGVEEGSVQYTVGSQQTISRTKRLGKTWRHRLRLISKPPLTREKNRARSENFPKQRGTKLLLLNLRRFAI